ncbi:glutathione S-transferase family protein [Methylophaga aminisulfidivorans MP]|uniref:Glutathione S-transferase family protein n=1 Tax=Methylophaga aminisulfidivorans MP TaxID=1026882 RepID=F5T338_9GAMM|nr:glutathione S-transferase [Methylophaga aminisulfidivorans]EGL53464.1 glutathione S-transferase family protein [Methylophaga aminisulfidivorans MP]
MKYPTLYSFRRCPYAMRARLALAASGIKTELREVVLKDKPAELVAVSPKATVPVLQTETGRVIDESIDIMRWALDKRDPLNWYQTLDRRQQIQCDELIANNDGDFKYYLDRYKYADRYPEHPESYYREQGEKTLQNLESLLEENGCLLSEKWTMADIALLPFVRQFALVDKDWFNTAPYPLVRDWLNHFLQSELFASVMTKYEQWHADQPQILFP